MLASVLYSRRVMRSKWTSCTALRRSFTNSWFASCISFGIIVYFFSPDCTCWCSAVGGVVGAKCCGVLEDMIGLVHPSSDPLRRRSLRERRSLCERRHFPLSGGRLARRATLSLVGEIALIKQCSPLERVPVTPPPCWRGGGWGWGHPRIRSSAPSSVTTFSGRLE